MKQKLLLLVASACMLSGCATINDSTAQGQPRDEGVYLTGSRLPQKTSGSNSMQTYDREGWEENTRGHKQINPQGR